MPVLTDEPPTTRRGLLAAAGTLLLATQSPGKTRERPPGQATCPANLWLTLPPTPSLPRFSADGRVRTGGADLFYADFGEPQEKGQKEADPVLMLHGGMANSNYWGKVVPTLQESRRIIVMDTRGHGRSTFGTDGLSYARFAADAVALLDHLRIFRVRIVGWSDGGNTGLELAMKNPDRVGGLFVFGANSDPGGVLSEGTRSATYRAYDRRCAAEYLAMSPDRDLPRLRSALLRMWLTEPRFDQSDLARISAPTMVADGEHEEIISKRHFYALASAIPASKLVIQPCVSHFALLQDPVGFTRLVVEALATPHAPPN